MSDVADLLVGLALPAVPVLALVTFVLLVVTSQPRAVVRSAVALGSALVVAATVYAVLWGRAFDALDAGRTPSPAVESSSDIALAIGTAAYVVLLALGAVRVRSAGRRRQRSW